MDIPPGPRGVRGTAVDAAQASASCARAEGTRNSEQRLYARWRILKPKIHTDYQMVPVASCKVAPCTSPANVMYAGMM